MEDRFETFTILINRINRNIRKLKNQEMADYGLKGIHVSCLHYLHTLGSLTPSELCEHCEEDKAAISRAVDFLRSEGFIEAPSDEVKHYKCPLVLSTKGKEAGEIISKKINSILHEINDSLSDAERAAFYKSLFAISSRLDVIAQEAGIH